MALFKRVVEAFIASREFDQATPSRLACSGRMSRANEISSPSPATLSKPRFCS
jgi:hypothetical protein